MISLSKVTERDREGEERWHAEKHAPKNKRERESVKKGVHIRHPSHMHFLIR